MDERPEIWTGDANPEDDFDSDDENIDNPIPFHHQVLSVFIHLLFAWQMTFSASDNSVDRLLNIIRYFLTMLQFVFGFDGFCQIIDLFPGTLFKARRFLRLDKDEFVKFVACPSCHKLFTFNDAVITTNGKRHSKMCDYVRFPNHPQRRMRTACGTSLMKTVVSADGEKKSFYPYKTYCFQQIKTSLQRILTRRDIQNVLKRNIISADDLYDIYDGEVWKEFRDFHGEEYFKDKRNFAGMLNIDWFQPFSGSEHSLGAIYIVLLNLPR